MFLFRWIGSIFKAIGGLFVPMFTMARGLAQPNQKTKWVLHALLVLFTLLVLGFIQWYFDISRYITAPFPYLRQAWLPLVGLVLYINLWLLWLVWRLYDPKPGPSQWPDIDYAWTQVTSALFRANIDPSRVPLFIILGRPTAGASMLFEAARIPLDINGAPEAQLSPLQLFAGKQAVFIVCADTCLLGVLNDRVSALSPAYLGSNTTGLEKDTKLAQTGSSMGGTNVGQEGSSRANMPRLEPDEIKPVTRDPEIMEKTQARLDHVCRLVRGMRHPWCPVNGILLVMPEQATANDFLGTQAAILAQTDVAVAQKALGATCPVVALFSGAENIPGFREFLGLIPKEKRDQRLGKPMPMALVKGDARRGDIIAKTIYWQCAELIPRLIIRTFQMRETDPVTGRGGASIQDIRTNRQLIRLIRAIWSRRNTMGHLCTRLIEGNSPEKIRLTGCYLAATGNLKRGQGFLTDLFAQLFEGQNFVSWSHDAVRDERRIRLMTWAGYLFTALVTLFTVVIATGLIRIGSGS
jgi:hypothetical protein